MFVCADPNVAYVVLTIVRRASHSQGQLVLRQSHFNVRITPRERTSGYHRRRSQKKNGSLPDHSISSSARRREAFPSRVVTAPTRIVAAKLVDAESDCLLLIIGPRLAVDRD